jgi:hypothetical protein
MSYNLVQNADGSLSIQNTAGAVNTMKFNADGTITISDGTTTTTLIPTEEGYIDGITPGTVTANKVLVVDSNKDLATLRNLTINGNFVTGSTTLTEAELGVLDAVTPGTAAASKALVLDGTLNIAGIAALATTGAITSTTEKADYRILLGVNAIALAGTATWTRTRVAQGDYVLRKTAANDTSIIGIDITEALRSTASKGLKLNTIDYIFRNTTSNLDAHSATLDRILYTNSEVVGVTSVPITGTLAVGQDADPQVSTLTITTPAYATAGDKYVLEITVDAAAGSEYDFIGVRLNFARNDL